MRKLALVVALAGASLTFPAEAATPAPALGLDAERFWNGGFVADDTEVFEYPIDLAGSGARLRVAIDTPSREDTFLLELVDPKGVVQASAENGNQFNDEAFAAKPVAGRWIVRVTPSGATRASFRLRAKLEHHVPAPPPGKVPLLPNLKTVPPYELTFVAPANPLNGLYPPDTVNPPLDAAGVHPVSCTADEAAPVEAGGAGAVRCLRLTSGPINVGAGPFDMRFSMTEDATDGDLEPTHLRGPIFQVIHNADGTSSSRDAGTYIFHTTHAHFHDENILTYELFKVKGTTLVTAGAGVKSGFCPADQLFGEWEQFVQEPAGYFGEGDSPTGNCFSPDDGFIGLTVGWGDVYRWQRPGQYVEFGTNTDGLYVVRSTVDKGNHVVELDDADNSAYALVRITGETITPIERGWGLSHLDPAKVVFAGSGPASRA